MSQSLPSKTARVVPNYLTMDSCEKMGRAGPAFLLADGMNPLAARVDILDPHDIIFTEIGAGLHLDDLGVDLAGIFEPVHGA